MKTDVKRNGAIDAPVRGNTVRLRRRREPIIIPNAENLTKEELLKAKRAEASRRQAQRKRGAEPSRVGGQLQKLTNQQLRKLSTEEMVELAKDTRNLTLDILGKKLASIMADEEKLDKTNLATLATVFGIMYDKTQLMQGLSTENIAVSARIDVNMRADDAIEELNKMRMRFQESNDK